MDTCLARFEALCLAAFADGDAAALAALALLAQAGSSGGPALDAGAGAEDAVAVSVLPSWWAPGEPPTELLVALGPPLVHAGALRLTDELAVALEDVKRRARRSAHALLGARRRAALAAALAGGDGASTAAWGCSPYDQAAVVARTQQLVTALAAAPGGALVAAPLLGSVALALDTALALSAAARPPPPRGAGGGGPALGGAAPHPQHPLPPPCVALLLPDEVLLEAGPPAAIRDVVGWLRCTLGFAHQPLVGSGDAASVGAGSGLAGADAELAAAAVPDEPPGSSTATASCMRSWQLSPELSDASLALVVLVLLRALGAGARPLPPPRRGRRSGLATSPPPPAPSSHASTCPLAAAEPAPAAAAATRRWLWPPPAGGGDSGSGDGSGPGSTGLTATSSASWQCEGATPASALEHWCAAAAAAAAAAAGGGAGLHAPPSSASAARSSGHHRHRCLHPYVPHTLAHRVVAAATLPALEAHLSRLGTAAPGCHAAAAKTGVGARGSSRGSSSGIVALQGDVAAPGTVVPLLPPHAPGAAAPVGAALPPSPRTNVSGARDVYQLPVPLADGCALLAPAPAAASAGGRGWCPPWLGYAPSGVD